MRIRSKPKCSLQPLVLAVAANTLFSSSALAQLEEVTVTAQKRAESLQDVPIAINALTGDSLRELGVSSGDDLTEMFPNLSLKAYTSVNSGFSIRGVGSQNFHVVAQQAVGTYADEVSLVSPFTSQLALFDMERIEVLRGPQNTLFGRNTTGGAVNFISRKPDVSEGLNGYVNANIGNEGRQDLEVAIGFPIGESLAGRLALQTANRDGVFEDVVDKEDTGAIERHAGRFQLLWQPGDLTEILFNAHVGYNRSDRGPRKAIGYWEEGSANIGAPGARGAADCPQLFSGDPERFENANNCVTAANAQVFNPSTPDDWNDVRDVANNQANVDFEGLNLRVDHSFETIDFTSITAYDEVGVEVQTNISSTGVIHFFPVQDATYEVFSQEFRLASTVGETFRWIAGMYYSHEEDELGTNIRNGGDTTPPFTVVPSTIIEQDVDIFSIYGQTEFDLREDLTLTVGLRWTQDEKDGESTTRVIAGTPTGFPPGPVAAADFIYTNDFMTGVTSGGEFGVCPPPVGGLPCITSVDVEQDLNEWGGKIGLDWSFNDYAMAYASYSRGFKSGAFDSRALAAFFGTADQPTDPEFLDAYEIGVKSTLLDDTLELNAALFYYEWEDLQTFATDDTGVPAFLNVPETELTGAEVEIKWAPNGGWFIQGGLGWNDSEIVDDGGLSTAREGSPLAHTPEFTASGLIRKEFQFDSGLLGLQANFSYADDQNSSNFENPIQEIDSTLFVNARAMYTFGDEEQYQVSLWGENLTEEKTCAQVGDEVALTNAITCLANPGMAFYGISAEFRF